MIKYNHQSANDPEDSTEKWLKQQDGILSLK